MVQGCSWIVPHTLHIWYPRCDGTRAKDLGSCYAIGQPWNWRQDYCLSVSQFPHQMRVWPDHFFGHFQHSLSCSWQDSWPISTLALPCTFTLQRWRKAQWQMLTDRSVGKILLKILNFSSWLPITDQSGVILPNLASQIDQVVACWLLFYYGSNSIIFLQNVTLTKCTFLVHYPMQNWYIVLSLLPFWSQVFAADFQWVSCTPNISILRLAIFHLTATL